MIFQFHVKQCMLCTYLNVKTYTKLCSLQRFFARKVEGVLNSIKEALPNFEEDQTDVFSSINTFKSESNYIDEESKNISTLKSAKSFILSDFFSSSGILTPAMSPSVENNYEIPKENFNKDEDQFRRPRFKFSPSKIEVMLYHLISMIQNHK